MYNCNIYPNSNTSGCSPVMLEHSLFEVGASPDVVKGVFYLLPIFHQGQLFLRYVITNNTFYPFTEKINKTLLYTLILMFNFKRYMETGEYQGFLPIALQHVKKHYNVLDVNILPWKLYTDRDIQLQDARVSSKRTTGTYIPIHISNIKSYQALKCLSNIIQYQMHLILNLRC